MTDLILVYKSSVLRIPRILFDLGYQDFALPSIDFQILKKGRPEIL